MSYQLSRLDLVVSNATTQITVNTNPSTQSYINGDIVPQDNVIAVNSTHNRFATPDDLAVALIKSTSTAASLINVTAKALNTTEVPISPTYFSNLNNTLKINYDGEYYVKLLLLNNNSSTIVDGSNNNYTIVNTSDSVWPGVSGMGGSTGGPFGTGASGFFNALESDFLRINNPISSLLGAEDFTVEFFIRGSTDWSTAPVIIDTGSNLGFQYWQVSITATGQVQFTYINGPGNATNVVTTSTMAITVWYHVAIVRNNTVQTPGNNFNIYINGISGVSALIANNWGDTGTSANTILIGKSANNTRYLPANLSNLRITQSAVYTGNFTPPISNLQVSQAASAYVAAIPAGRKLNTKYSTTLSKSAVYNPTQLPLYNNLAYTSPTGQTEVYDNSLIINSYVNSTANKNVISSQATINIASRPDFYITGSDAPNISGYSLGASVLVTNTGGAFFNGAAQYLLITGTTSGPLDLAAGAGNWTVECWFNPGSVTGQQSIFWKGGTSGSVNPSYAFFLSGTGGQFIVGDGGGGGAVVNVPGSTFAINTWYHFALVRNGTTFTAWINGVAYSTTLVFTMSNTSNNKLTIGSSTADNSTRYFNGQISNFRIVKGVAVYTGNFTLPNISSLTATQSAGTNISAISGTQTSLLTLQNSTLLDNSTYSNAITNNLAGVQSLPYTPPLLSTTSLFYIGGAGQTVSTPSTPAYIINTTKYNDPTQVEGYFSSFIPQHTGEEDRIQAWV
jgi:hypothetical protein